MSISNPPIFQFNGGLKSADKAITMYSREIYEDNYGQSFLGRPNNHHPLEGYLELENINFDPLIFGIQFYLFEMELMPMPSMSD